MKYLSILFVLVVFVATNSATAQTSSSLSGKTFTIMLAYTVDNEVELFDKIAFGNNTVTSEYFGNKGYSGGTFTASGAEDATQFQATFQNATGGSVLFTGNFSSGYMHGTISVSDATGNEGEMIFRGMTTALWNQTIQQAGTPVE